MEITNKSGLLRWAFGLLTGIVIAASVPALAQFVGSPSPSSITITGDNNVVILGVLPESLPVGLTEKVNFGATSGTQYSIVGDAATMLTDAVGVNTSTQLVNDLVVTSGSQTVSSTVIIGSSYEGSTRRGVLCFWNGTNYTAYWVNGNGAGAVGSGFTTSTAATCP